MKGHHAHEEEEETHVESRPLLVRPQDEDGEEEGYGLEIEHKVHDHSRWPKKNAPFVSLQEVLHSIAPQIDETTYSSLLSSRPLFICK